MFESHDTDVLLIIILGKNLIWQNNTQLLLSTIEIQQLKEQHDWHACINFKL